MAVGKKEGKGEALFSTLSSKSEHGQRLLHVDTASPCHFQTFGGIRNEIIDISQVFLGQN